MTNLLFINSSPRAADSESVRLAEALLEAYVAAAPDARVDRLDLFAEPLPIFDGVAVEAKMTVIGGAQPGGEAAEAWARIEEVFARLDAAADLVFTVPMWNSGIPWVLKHFIDTVTQPGLTFRFDPEAGYRGLVTGKRAVALYTSRVYRAGVEPAFGVDYHSTYFEYWLRYIGIEDIGTVRLQPTYPTADLDERRASAIAEAAALGRALAREPTAATT